MYSLQNLFGITVTILILTVVSIASAQNKPVKRGGYYKWIDVVQMTRTNASGIPIDSIDGHENITESDFGQRFWVLDVRDGFAIIKVLDYTFNDSTTVLTGLSSSEKSLYRPDKSIVPTRKFFKYNYKGSLTNYAALDRVKRDSRDYGSNQIYFRVPLDVLDAHAVRNSYIAGSLAVGVINFPFKYRPQASKADFSGAFNFGAAIGYKFRRREWQKWSHSILSGYSISNVSLDSFSVERNASDLATTNNFTAFSLSLGWMVQYEKVQAGIFIGTDRISRINHEKFHWVYQGKPWFSIGFGYAIFSPENESTQRAEKEN